MAPITKTTDPIAASIPYPFKIRSPTRIISIDEIGIMILI